MAKQASMTTKGVGRMSDKFPLKHFQRVRISVVKSELQAIGGSVGLCDHCGYAGTIDSFTATDIDKRRRIHLCDDICVKDARFCSGNCARDYFFKLWQICRLSGRAFSVEDIPF